MRNAFVIASALVAVAAATPAARAQMPPRAVMLEDIERSRGNVLKYLDIAPDSMLRYTPTPGVRTFGQQIGHAASSNAMIVRAAFSGKMPTAADMPDTSRMHDKAALKALVNESYDTFAKMVRDASDEQLAKPATFFGSTKTSWRWIATSLEHATWTLGQTVPYLRANGVKPPAYLPF